MAGLPVRWHWSFGDGTTSAEKEPRHTFRMPGYYRVILTVWDADNESATASEWITVYDWDYLGGINVAKTTECIRHAIPQVPGQGKGWSDYNGVSSGVDSGNWPFPEAVVGTCKIIDSNDDVRQLVLDSNSWRWFEIGRRDVWRDGEGEYAGSEIESEILFRRNVPSIRATASLRHGQSHLFFEPWNSEVRNTARYDENGFPRTMEVDLFIRADGGISDAAVTMDVPRRGQLIFDRHIESEALQQGCRIRGAPWRLPEVQMWYKQLDSGAAPPYKIMSESDWSYEFTGPLLWMTRNQIPNMNMATASAFGGSYAGTVAGPDGQARTGVAFGATDSFWVSSIGDLNTDFTLICWVRNPSANVNLFNFANGGTLQLALTGTLNWSDASNSINFNTTGSLAGWNQFVVMRSGDNMIAYQNGSLLNTVAMTNPDLTYNGRVTLASNCSLAFVYILERALTADAIEWAYNDVVQNQANSMEPPL